MLPDKAHLVRLDKTSKEEGSVKLETSVGREVHSMCLAESAVPRLGPPRASHISLLVHGEHRLESLLGCPQEPQRGRWCLGEGASFV